jgi:uncharacterized protein
VNRSIGAALFAGVLFGVGLVLSGMTSPDNVQGFLDVAGTWNPRLMFVMGGAVVTHGLCRWVIARQRQRPLFTERFAQLSRDRIDGRLVFGAATFGVGWGLSGYCPGPVIVSWGTGTLAPLLFGGAMFVGFSLFALWEKSVGAAPGADCGVSSENAG